MFHPYRDDYEDPKANAQRNLLRRTHYVDDDTLAYFKSRILFGKSVADGLGFAIVVAASCWTHLIILRRRSWIKRCFS